MSSSRQKGSKNSACANARDTPASANIQTWCLDIGAPSTHQFTMTQTNEQSASLPASNAADDEEPVTYVSVYARPGNIGDGWDDYESAERDWKHYLQRELHAWLSNMYPDAEISVEVELVSGSPTLNLDTDATDIDEEWMRNAMQQLFQNFCDTYPVP